MMDWWWYLVAFFVGSLPFGAWVAKARGIDITKVGSGNIGATNVHRTLGLGPGLLVLVLDVAKGLAPSVFGTVQAGSPYGTYLGVSAVLGHCLSPFLRFRGGKGIATGLGMLVGSDWRVALVAFAVFVVAVGLTRYISLGSVLAAASLPIWAVSTRADWPVTAIYTALAAFVIYKHKPNIVRLLAGTESKFSFSKKHQEASHAP